MSNHKIISIDDFKEYFALNRFPDKIINEIIENYSQNWRFYHTLNHIYDIINILKPIESKFENWNRVLWITLYHDFIYIPKNSNNEELSAQIAFEKMINFGHSEIDSQFVKSAILATKTHKEVENSDIELFLDADLSILGKKKDIYIEYQQNIRKEYSFFSDKEYNIGRVSILKYFLNMKNIYKTPHFREILETQAKENISNEIEFLIGMNSRF
ncbi:hypothetical protein JXR93_00915 [bacterium]|nr:hypothetical protein [bacterium]